VEKLRLSLPGLKRASCVSTLEQVMRAQPGVIWATLNFAAGEAAVVYDPAAFDAARLMESIRRLGFELMADDKQTNVAQSGLMLTESLHRVRDWARERFHPFT
jgi:cation transport ATPase